MTIEEYKAYQEKVRLQKESVGHSLGLGVIIWEDSTFLRIILTELRPIMDHIVLGWQTFSYRGNRLEKYLLEKMEKEIDYLIKSGLADEVIKIENPISAKYVGEATYFSEVTKRNVLSTYLTELGSDATMIIDSDEFYFAEDVVTAFSNLMKTNEYAATYCRVKTFVKSLQIEHLNNEYTNFLSRSFVQPTFLLSAPINIVIDRTRIFNINFKKYIYNDLYCYHLSWIRANVEEKINNYSQVHHLGNRELLISELQQTDEDLLKQGYMTINGYHYELVPCSCPRIEEFFEVIMKLT